MRLKCIQHLAEGGVSPGCPSEQGILTDSLHRGTLTPYVLQKCTAVSLNWENRRAVRKPVT